MRSVLVLVLCAAAVQAAILESVIPNFKHRGTTDLFNSTGPKPLQPYLTHNSTETYAVEFDFAALESPPETVVAADKLPPASEATTIQQKKKLGPCCDDMECGDVDSPDYIDCDHALDCSVATCPDLAQELPRGARFAPAMMGQEDECLHRAPFGQVCTCTCRCVCIYPNGAEVWLEWPVMD